ncbi:diguanylate cyclase [Aquipuribacter hungaricus]|uniref:Diguanylate cyclase n=1 Tax=Aquipuribacter hungaricus TaxID=545624 RepID=A0ABV7WBV0_9MICO
MSVRARVAVALVVAAVVPILGVFGVVGVLLPSSVGFKDEQRLHEAATATASLLARDCEAVAERAALVASQLLVAVSTTPDGSREPDVIAREAAQGVTERLAQDGWLLLVLDAQGQVVVAQGAEPGQQVDAGVADDRSCSEGALGSPASLTARTGFAGENSEGQPEGLGSVVVSAPVDEAYLASLGEQVGLTGRLGVVADGALVASGGDSPLGREEGDERELAAEREELEQELVTEASSPRLLQDDVVNIVGDTVGDQPFVVAATPLGDVEVVAVGRAPTSIDRNLALAFVATAFGTAALVWLLSASLTRPLTELAELARRIAAGDDLPAEASTDGAADADADVQGVSAVLGSLARDLRASEADAQRRRGAFLDAFGRFGDALQQTHDRDGLLQTVLQAALLAADAPMGLALHHDRSSRLSKRELSLRARSRGDGPTTLDDLTRRTLLEVAERALLERTVIEVPGDDERGPVLAVPLGSSSRPLGAVVVAREVGEPGYDAVAFEAIGALAGNAGTALANIKEHQEVERLSVTDPLTGVNNFRHLSTMLAREMERATRFGHPLGVLMLDIDRFKPVNDTYGHAAGDAVLRELARRVKECVREVDTVARYGGEEFALLLPETDLDGAERLAGRVLTAIRSERFRLPDGTLRQITASMGVAGFPHHGDTATAVMGAADAALYRAKTGGRDRVEVARSPEELTAGSAPSAGGPGLGSPERDLAP